MGYHYLTMIMLSRIKSVRIITFQHLEEQSQMYLNKYSMPMNFRYMDDLRFVKAGKELKLKSKAGNVSFTAYKDGLIRITSTLARTEKVNRSCSELSKRKAADASVENGKGKSILQAGAVSISVNEKTGAFVFSSAGKTILKSTAAPFGVNGEKSILKFDRPIDTPVYGLGEKTGGLDKAGKSYNMWTVDVVEEFPFSFMRDDFDPSYVDIPFYISKYKDDYFGVFLDNPYASFIHAGLERQEMQLAVASSSWNKAEPAFAIGTEKGLLDMYLIPGPDLADVVRRFSNLTGRHEMPPVWALGYQQCRWSYKTAKEAMAVADRLDEEKIPTGGLWLDIDYMDRYGVFTYNEKTFSPKDREKLRKKVEGNGGKLVTIIDPGVRKDKKFEVYKKGHKKDIFCKTPENLEYTGIVWPGKTVFPDFSLTECRRFWAEHVRKHLEGGITGIWNDMNDPCSGPVQLDEMRFQRGKADHDVYHNQYGHLMAKATWDGFNLKDANGRPFILTRSGYSGTQKYAAIWTGDNASNVDHLAMSIPMSINLALSGVSFNGPDVGGFADHCTEELMVAWMKAGALFPFFRNHSTMDSRQQEPYAFTKKALGIIKKCINTRAMLLPYIYNQFYQHWKNGDAVMRPLSYEFKGTKYERISDQYMIGPYLMVAPFVDIDSKTRTVVLPPGEWFSMADGKWIKGGRNITVKRTDDMLIFVRDGSIIPCIDGNNLFPQPDFKKIAFHVFAKNKFAECEYYEDDRATRNYQNGEYNLINIKAVKKGNALSLNIIKTKYNYPNGITKGTAYFYGLKPADSKTATTRWPFKTIKVCSSRFSV